VIAFFDTNILIYAYSTDAKRTAALSVVAEGGVISVQVLNEFTNVLRKKQKQDLANNRSGARFAPILLSRRRAINR
jgi:predicted nucleic acid-binding protein